MLSGKPLFPGRDYHHQLTLILDVLGTPTLDEFYAITTRRSRDYIRALPFRKRRPFATLFPNANPLAVDFLTKTLVCTEPFLAFKHILISQISPDFWSQKAYHRRGCPCSSLSRSIRMLNLSSRPCQRWNWFFYQHDPDDEPVAPPLDPEFFEFDCQFTQSSNLVQMLTSILFAPSTQRWHQ